MGPPTEPPNWWMRNAPLGEMGLRILLAQVLALSDLSRKNSKAEPWKSLVPDLVTTLMTAPPARPYSAE